MNIAEMDLHRNIYPMNKGWSYACHETHRAWMAWQESRASLVVELPDEMTEFSDRRSAIIACREAVEAAGVTVK